MTILFERINIFQVILLIKNIKRAGSALLFYPYQIDKLEKVKFMSRIAIWLVKAINPAIKILDIEKEILFPLAYMNNYESDIYVEDIAKRFLEDAPSCFLIRDIVGSDLVNRVYKQCLLKKILPVSQFYRYAKKMYGNVSDQGAIIVPANMDYFGLHKYFFNKEEFSVITTRNIRFFNKLIYQMSKALSVLFLFNGFLLFSSIGYQLAKRIKGSFSIRSRTKIDIKVDVVMPLVYGFAGEDKIDPRSQEVFNAQRLDWDDSFIFNEKLNVNNVAFFFSDWPFTPTDRGRMCKLMQARGIKYFDPNELHFDRKHLLLILKTVVKISKFALLNPKVFFETPYISNISSRIIYKFFEEMFFNSRVSYGVFVEWGDYYSQSIIRTIVANLFGRITVGMHHSAPSGPYGFPQIRYSYINELCIWGEALRRSFGKHWDIMHCHIIGLPRLDVGFNALQPDRLKELKKHYHGIFGGETPVVLIPLPNPPKNVSYQIESRFDEFLRGLLRCCLELPPFRIVFRPRFAEHWKDYCEYELIRKIIASGRAIMDLMEFSTYEWIAISDLVIVTTTSSLFIEASKMGKKCFTFDLRALAEMVLKGYGKESILITANDIFNAVNGLFNNFKDFSCSRVHLAKDFCAFMDGNNTARFREVISQHINRNETDNK